MTKAQQMLATAGFPDTAAGRAAFHKQYPTPESFFKVYGNIHGNVLQPTGPSYTVDNVTTTTPRMDEGEDMYKAGGKIHIKPSHRGRFTEYKKRTGKTTAEALHSKDPHVRQMANFARNAAKWKHEDGGEVMYGHGGTVDALQLMGMPTPPMYGDGGWHPTLTLSTENNPNKVGYLNSPYYQDVQSVDNRNILAGTLPIVNNKLNLTGSYSDANDGTYTAGAEYSLGDVLSGGSKGPSRKYDNPDIAHKGHSFIDPYGHARVGVTNKDGKVIPYWGFDVTAAHQMGRVKGPKGLRQPKGTVYVSGEYNNVEDPLNDMYVNDNYLRANLGGSYNFGKGLGVYGEAGYDVTRKSPRAEVGLKKTFADGGHITHYIPSYNFGHVQSANNTYRHGFGYGGPIGKYDFGSTIKTIGAGAFGAGAGLIDTVSFGMATPATDALYNTLQDVGGSSESEKHQQNLAKGIGKMGGAFAGASVNPAAIGSAITEGSQGLGQTIAESDPNNPKNQQIGSLVGAVGGIGGMATSMGAFGTPGAGASGIAKTAKFNTTGLGKFANKAAIAGQGFNAINSGNPMQMMGMFAGMRGMGNTGGNMNAVNSNINSTPNFSSDASLVSSNRYMNQGIDFNSTAPSFGYYAMGGAVNAPNMMKYAQGGMTPPPIDESMQGASQGNGMTEINVEHGELLTDPNGNIVTEYGSNALPPHPADGSMDDKGTVNAPEGYFVVKKNLAEKYKAAMKNNDKLHADAMRNNIAIDKQRKEQTMMARNGGMVGQYGYGGGVKMFGLGGEDGIPFIQQNPYTMAQPNAYGFDFGLPNSTSHNYLMSQLQPQGQTSLPSLNLQTQPFGFQKTTNPYTQNWNPIDNSGLQPYDPKFIPSSPPSSKEAFLQGYTGNTLPSSDLNKQVDPNFVMPAQGPFMTERTYKSSEDNPAAPLQGVVFTDAEGNERWGNPYVSDYGDTSSQFNPYAGTRNKMDVYDYMRFAPAVWNTIQALKKPTKVPGDLGNVDTNVTMPKLNSTATLRAMDAEAAKTRYLGRQSAGNASDYLAFLTSMHNQQGINKAKVMENFANAQAGLDAEGIKLSKSLQAQNAQAGLQRYMLQAQADAVPTEYASKAAANLGEIGNMNYTYNRAYPIFEQMYPEFATRMRQNRIKTRR